MPPKLKAEVQKELRERVSGIVNGIIFRRVSSQPEAKSLVRFRLWDNGSTSREINPESFDHLTDDDLFRRVSEGCDKFHAFTHSKTLQGQEDPPSIRDLAFFLGSTNFCQPDMRNGILSPGEYTHPPRVCTNPTMPRVNDLVAIVLSPETEENIKKGIYRHRGKDGEMKGSTTCPADRWFVCSEQFMKACTAITNDWHPSFDAIIKKKGGRNEKIKVVKKFEPTQEEKENTLRGKFMSSNRLCTNGGLKYKIAFTDTYGLPPPVEEMNKRFHYHRFEYSSVRWVDILACLVLMCRYGELPCGDNVPNNVDPSLPKRKKWDLPSGFVLKILHRYTEESNLVNSLENDKNTQQWIKFLDAKDDNDFTTKLCDMALPIEYNESEALDTMQSPPPEEKNLKFSDNAWRPETPETDSTKTKSPTPEESIKPPVMWSKIAKVKPAIEKVAIVEQPKKTKDIIAYKPVRKTVDWGKIASDEEEADW